MLNPAEEQEWRGLIERLQAGTEPQSPEGTTPIFDEAAARKRVGSVITKAVLGDHLYQLYRIYCGDPSLPR
jgi:hypothetical protein